MFKRLLLLVVIIASLIGMAQAQDKNKDGWEQVVKKDDLFIEMRKHEGSDICDVRSSGYIYAPIAAVEALLRDVSGMKDYGFRIAMVEKVNQPDMGLVSAKDKYYAYLRVDCPWPVMDRDALALFSYELDPQTGTVYIESKQIKSDYRLGKDCIRSPMNYGKYTLIPKGKNSTYCVIEATGDPGGAIPPAVVNLFARFGSQWTFKKIKNLAASDKYNKPGITLTTTTLVSK